MSRQNALALYVPPKEFQTPFEGFMSALLARHARAARTMAGSAEWTDFPVEQAVADGLWAVMLRVAEKFGEPLATERQVVEKIAPRVNRVVNAGLALTYGTPAKAALAFEKKVMDTVLGAARARRGWPLVPMQELWQAPSAQFFAGFMRMTQEYHRELASVAEQIRDLNDLDAVRWATVISVVDEMGFHAYLELTDLDAEPIEYDAGIYARCAAELELARTTLVRVQSLRRLPYDLARLPSDVIRTDVVIQETWLNTQLLLAAANLPDSEHLVGVEYNQALLGLARLAAADLTERFFRRMRKRGARFQDTDVAILTEEVLERIGSLRNWTPVLDRYILQNVFLKIDPVRSRFKAQYALDEATVSESGLQEDGPDSRPLHPAAIAARLAESVEWKDVTHSEVREMIAKGTFTHRMIADGIVRMRPDRRDAAVRHLLASEGMDEEAAARLFELDLVGMDEAFINAYVHLAPPKLLKAHLPALIAKMAPGDGAVSPLAFISAVERLGERDGRALLSDPKLRESLYAFILEHLSGIAARDRYGIDVSTFATFWAFMGSDLWRRYILMVELLFREDVYGNPTRLEALLAPWEETAGSQEATLDFTDVLVLGGDEARVRKVFREHPEEDIFRWAHEGEPDLPGKLRAFLKNRAAYFAARGIVLPKRDVSPAARHNRAAKGGRRRKASSAPARKGARKR